MAKYSSTIRGDFKEILDTIDSAVLDGSISASFEDGETHHENGYDSAVRVYERYSYMGGNRVSLTVFLFGKEGNYKISLITSGGSKATFFKINTIGEESFLDDVVSAIEGLA